MNIAIAQLKSMKGDIPANIEKHIKFIERACLLNADFIFFPELSLTGYEPGLAEKLAVDKNDKRFDVLQQTSDQKMISFAVGVPTISENG
ncbi:MAG TPA: nitrilase-related carbon-nitrogen hydrolase, partial [Flavobacterium sp.]|nr:nitrilase-related carbon-nitrogen hydrolase [Flavobacterium sp.]